MTDNNECIQPLPRKITSMHTLCAEKSSAFRLDDDQWAFNNNIPEDFIAALKNIKEKEYAKAFDSLEVSGDSYTPAKYQMACMYYDGLGRLENHVLAVSLMKEIVKKACPYHADLIPCAQYNIGRAYYEGFGVKQSDEVAEQWWLRAAKDGDASGCVKAQSILAMYYSRRGELTTDFKKSHFWHQEATANGSLESQATLGVMYEFGLGVTRDKESSFKCFKSAAEKGNIFAMGNLALQYYRFKMFRNAFDVAKKLVLMEDTSELSRDTDCLEAYIKKGISLGRFIYGRCIEKGVVADIDGEDNAPLQWYSKAAIMDPDTAQYMQDLVGHGEI